MYIAYVHINCSWSCNIILSLFSCCSYVGRRYNYVQPVNIGPECEFGSILHQIGHVIGFWHEHSRPDRDKYVTIKSQNSISKQENYLNTTKSYYINSLGVPYDFSSIMHYYQDNRATDDKITISSKERDIPFGGAPELSALDINQTNLLYKKECG